MKVILGLDIGTSSSKALIIDEKGRTLGFASSSYDFDTPRPGYAEQDAEQLFDATLKAINDAMGMVGDSCDVVAIGITGQMHGLVALDKDKKPVGKIIIWADKRSSEIKPELEGLNLEKKTKNPFSAGFLLPSLVWVKKNNPVSFAAIRYVMLPKDYIRFRLTGNIGTDFSDASGTFLFNTETESWDKEAIESLGLSGICFPEIHRSAEIAGTLQTEAAARCLISEDTPVVYGGGDSPMQLVGNGLVSEGQLCTNIGTASQINYICRNPLNVWNKLNTFHHIPDNLWITVGASLNGGIALKWAKKAFFDNHVDFNGMDMLAKDSKPGANGVVFLPFLCGERSPYMNPDAKGILYGLTISTEQHDIVRSIMESVVFSFRDCLEVILANGQKTDDVIIAAGGGARSPLWLQIQADVLKKEIRVFDEAIEAAKGACLTAAVGAGLYSSFEEAAAELAPHKFTSYYPDPANFSVYDDRFEVYRSLYRNNVNLFS